MIVPKDRHFIRATSSLHFPFFLCWSIYVLMGSLSSCVPSREDRLVIATSANMQFAIKELAHTFMESTGVDCDIVTGSSGKLAAQLEEGAPFCIFIAADMEYAQHLYDKGIVTAPEVYAEGRLVLWSLRTDVGPSFKDLLREDITHIALPNPATAPYGRAAMDALRHMGLEGRVKEKFVFGESIAQTHQYLSTQAADIGITAKSMVVSLPAHEQGKWIEIDADSYAPLLQGMALSQRIDTALQKQAQDFRDFLFSEKAQLILKNHGYLIPKK